MTNRTECPQSIFGGCPGETCTRDCSSPRTVPVINLDITREHIRMHRIWLLALNCAIGAAIIFFLVAANEGLGRTEASYQTERRV